jgi:nucleoside-diphosphate-sugar epimerase
LNTSNAKRWRVGLLGAGYISDAHARALAHRRDVELHAVCDASRERASQAAARYGIPHAYSSLEEMLASEVQAVHVLLPPDRHADAARRILDAGRHVFVEKPMAARGEDCAALAEAAAARRLGLGVNHNFLFVPAYERLRRDAADGTLGALDQVTVSWMFPLALLQSGPFSGWMLRAPGNLFLEIGSHLMAFVLDLVGPLDDLEAAASNPVELPGGARVYRRWRLRATSGRTAVDVVLSIANGPSERSIAVRGHGALATCHFDRNLYYRHEPIGYGLLDNLSNAMSVARQLAACGTRNFVSAAAGTLTKSPRADIFVGSIARSVGRFYDTFARTVDSRLSGTFGAEVIRECERVVAAARVDTATAQSVAALPPVQRPSVLVLGASGFIGRHLVRALVQKGIGVRVGTRSSSTAQAVLAGVPAEIVQGDTADAAFLDQALDGIDAVYHLAKADGKTWDDYYRQDVQVTRLVAERALEKRVRRFIYTGTIDSYFSGDPRACITADSPLDPLIERRNLYARSKAACEAELMRLHRERGLPLVVLRPGIVIGKGAPHTHWGVGMFLSDTKVRLWGRARHPLPFVLVDDVVEALVLALDKPGIEGQAFLVTDGPLLSGRDYVEAVSTACGVRLRARPTPIWGFFVEDLVKQLAKHAIRHPARRRASYRDWASRAHRASYDSSKTREVLGWQPAGTRKALVERGVMAAVRETLR